MNDDDSIARPIDGFPGYRVLSDGRVQSHIGRTVLGTKGARGSWRDLKPTPQRKGHLCVCLSRDGKKYYRFVHRLVLEAFVGPCPPGMEACHFPDRDPANNRLDNLRWDTRQANHDDAVAHGTTAATRGEKHCNAKLSEADVIEIRRLKATGVSMDVVAFAFRVKRATIEAIVYRKSWKHIP
jgi:hypothetical protein